MKKDIIRIASRASLTHIKDFHHHRAQIEFYEVDALVRGDINQWTKEPFKVFRSYATAVAIEFNGYILKTAKKYSQTTSRQVNRYIKENFTNPNMTFEVEHGRFKKLLEQYDVTYQY